MGAYVGVGIGSDELLVSIDYRLDPANYHWDIGCRMGIYHRLSSNDASSIAESASIVSHDHIFTSGDNLHEWNDGDQDPLAPSIQPIGSFEIEDLTSNDGAFVQYW